MSTIPPEATSALLNLLSNLGSADNNVRSAAETSLNDEWIAQRFELLMVGLSEQTVVATDQTVCFPSPSPLCFIQIEREIEEC